MLPVSAAYIALAKPAMEVIHVGDNRVELYAAALASLAVGLFFYCTFLLLARCSYALGDSRTPALTSFALRDHRRDGDGGGWAHGRRRCRRRSSSSVLGHSLAYLLAATIMWVVLRRRLARPLFPHALWRALGLSVLLGVGAWLVERVLSPNGRVPTLATLALIGLVGGVAYLAMLRLLPRRPGLTGAAIAPEPDLVADLDL